MLTKISFTTVAVAHEVFRSGNLTVAANNLKISQPAVSLHMQRLEKFLGFSPIVRVGNKMVVVSEECLGLNEELVSIEAKLSSLKDKSHNSLPKVGICSFWSAHLVQSRGCMDRFSKFASLVIDEGADLLDMYRQGKVDAVIGPIELVGTGSIELGDVELNWAGAFPFSNGDATKRIRAVLCGATTPIGVIARDWLKKNGVSYEIVMETDKIWVAVDACACFDAVTLLPNISSLNHKFSVPNAWAGIGALPKVKLAALTNERRYSFFRLEELFAELKSTF